MRRPGAHSTWIASAATAIACAVYLNARTDLVPRWGQWYMPVGKGQPYLVLQLRALLSGRLAVLPGSLGATHDYDWGRGGMHQQWGLGVALLATPFHLLARLFGAPGFPDSVRLLVFYAVTTMGLAHALRRTSRPEPTALAVSAAAAGFVMTFPTFVGLLSARQMIFEHTIAMGALWSVLLLSGVLWLLDRCTPPRLLMVCVAAAFSLLLRPPLAIYGATTLVLALVIATRAALRGRWIGAAIAAYAGVSGSYFVLTYLRFGSPFVAGFENCVSGSSVNRLNRWGLGFARVPLLPAAKEMFATLFLMDPVPAHTMTPPPAVQPFVVGERWREYYSPTFDGVVLALWLAALVLVGWRVVRGRLWRGDRGLGGEVRTVVGAWALPPAIVLFLFYARIGNLVTRYAVDLYPAFAAASLCVGMSVVDAVRGRAPDQVPSARLAIACAVALYWAIRVGPTAHMTPPTERADLDAQIATVEAHLKEPLPDVPRHFACGEPRGRSPVHTHLEDWHTDCTFTSGMVFAMPHSPCVSFTLRPGGASWVAADEESLAGFRVNADFDPMVRCGEPAVDGASRRITMCDPRPPRFLLESMRLYAVATLDPNLGAADRLRLMRIDAAPACR